MISISYSRVPLCLADGSVSVSAVDSCLRAGCFSSSMNKVIALNSRDCGGFARRHFSQVSRAKSQNEDGGFGKLFKQAKLLKSHVKKDIDSGLLASNDVNAMASAEDVVGDMKLGSSISSSSLSNNNPKSKVRGRQKKQSRTNTKKGQPSGVIASDEAAVVDSYPKSSTTMINSQSPTEGLEVSSY